MIEIFKNSNSISDFIEELENENELSENEKEEAVCIYYELDFKYKN